MITTESLNIGYTSTILQNINLTLNNGNLYILIGRNGSGKSTFLKTLMCELLQMNGDILLNDKNSKTIDHRDLTNFIGMVNSRFPEVDFMSVSEFVSLGKNSSANLFGQLQEPDKQKVEDVLNKLDISRLRDRLTSELSDGERQLTAIARILAQDSPNILLDEPTAYLDYRNKVSIIEALKRIAAEENKCIVISSHDIDIALESNCPFLLVDQKQQTIVQENSIQSKEDILSKAF